MGIKVLSLEAKKYWKPRVEMLVFRPPEGENPDPRVLSIYLMFCTYLTLYFLSFSLYRLDLTRQLEVTKVTAADCKPFGGPPTHPRTQDP